MAYVYEVSRAARRGRHPWENTMSNRPSKVSTGASMSLDGFIAGPGESGFEHLFAYMGSGEVEVPTAQPAMTLRMAPENAAFFRDLVARTGAIVVGRHLYDFTGGWGGIHPMGCPVVVLTHRPPAEAPSEQFTSSPRASSRRSRPRPSSPRAGRSA